MATEPAPGPLLLIKLERWQLWSDLGPASPFMPRKYAFQGGLSYSRAFDVRGHIQEPVTRRGQRARVWISPTRQDLLKFGPNGLRRVGQLNSEHEERGWDISVSLLLPDTAVPAVTTCLATVWKYLRLSTFDIDDAGASVSAWTFSTEP
jgi:hypothetical protein